MIFEEACRILAVRGTESRQEIKKRYRQLMHQVHPDVLRGRPPVYAYTAREINAAYEHLIEQKAQTLKQENREKKAGEARSAWQAPVNRFAYTQRLIFVDDIRIAEGKYFYTEEEGFRMFLRSIYYCSRKLLEPFPGHIAQKYLGECAYLLSQQFINRQAVLDRYETDAAAGGTIYYFPAMLETEGRRCALSPGTILAPAGVRNHRLYLRHASGTEAGYISFHDDLIYYALIPLFEQRRAQVKVQVTGSINGNNNKRSIKVRTLDLWVKLLPDQWSRIEVLLSDRIAALLKTCAEEAKE